MTSPIPPQDPTPYADILRRGVLMRQYENELQRVVDRILHRAYSRLEDLLLRQDPTAVALGRQRQRLDSLDRRARRIVNQAFRDIDAAVKAELLELAPVAAQITIQEAAAFAALRLPSRNLFAAIVTTDPIQGAPLRDWWGQQSVRAQNEFRRQVQLGLTRRESVADIVRRIRGRVIRRRPRVIYDGGALRVTRNAAFTLVRTAVNEVYNRSAMLTLQRNEALVWGFEWAALLSERTCEECGNLDGERWKLDDPARREPPAHPNDRCSILAVFQANQPRRRETFPEWFERQDMDTKARIVGVGKATLLAKGKADYSDLVRRDGRPITLERLKTKLRIVN